MTKTKSGNASMPAPTAQTLKQQQQHSVLFYISPRLFHNKRLKQKRAKRTELLRQRQLHQLHQYHNSYKHNNSNNYNYIQNLKTAKGGGSNHNNNINNNTSSSRRKQSFAKLQPDVTIDLLSDDDDNNIDDSLIKPTTIITTQQPQQQQMPQQQQFQHFIVCPSQLDLTQLQQLQLSNAAGNFRLIPLSNLTLDTLTQKQQQLQLQQQSNSITKSSNVGKAEEKFVVAAAAAQVKRKRKSQQPQRHSQPIIVNTESIVLTDDDDENMSDKEPPASTSTPTHTPTHTPAPLTTTKTTTATKRRTLTSSKATKTNSTPTVAVPAISPSRIAQVDEEVTVSLVPRSSTAGNCNRSPHNQTLFPMLPDETTVHTVIANRIYELSLTKLREGLASFAGNSNDVDAAGTSPNASHQPQQQHQQHGKPTNTRRKGQKIQPPASLLPQQEAPISLKLSSDLSISLISDDEDNASASHNHHRQNYQHYQQQQQLLTEKLQRELPQLAVQQVHVPVTLGGAADACQVPRRRKLG